MGIWNFNLQRSKVIKRKKFGVVVPCIWFEIRINYQLDAIEYLFTLARHVSGLYAHLQEQWVL